MKDQGSYHTTFTKTFSCISYNVRGLTNLEKCRKILNKFVYPFKEKSPGIVCLQELKLNFDTGRNLVNHLKGYKTLLSLNPGCAAQGFPSSEGVSLSIHNSLNPIIMDKKVEKGWLILAKCRILDKVCVIGSVYMPTGCPVNIYRKRLNMLEAHLKYFKCDNIIMQGDFNLSLDSASSPTKVLAEDLDRLLDKWDLQDMWRIQNPHSNRCSFHSLHHMSSRLDYCFVSLNFACYVADCIIGNAYCSDHSPVISQFSFNAPGGKRPFIFPIDLCYSDQFRLELNKNLEQVKVENDSANPHTKWELIKSTIRSTALKFKGLQSKIRKELVEEYEAKISHKMFLRDSCSDRLGKKDITTDIDNLNKQLDALFSEGKAIKYAGNLARWYGEKDKCSKYFLDKFKIDKGRPVISQLMTNDGVVTNNQAILKQAHSFFSSLYQEEPIFLPTDKLDSVRTLTSGDIEIMAQDISIDELFNVVKSMRPSSAPGNDGITVKFYLHFWELVKNDLFSSVQHSLLVGKLSSSQRQGLIRLFPKKNTNLLLVSNWRPISLLNVDYKLLTKVFAIRLKHILPDIINQDQRGFVAGRRISHSILDVLAIIETVIEQEEDYLICSIDIRKAFDSINWEFLRYALQLFDFPPEFITWFNIFYSDRTAFVVNNNERSDPINISKGNFQGCPLSPLFFVLAIEILAVRIRNNPEIIGIQVEDFCKKINLVADDILLVFKNNFSGRAQVDEELKEFSMNSGLRVNPDKSSVIRINKNSSDIDQDTFPSFQRQKTAFKYIGLNCTLDQKNLWKENIPRIIDKIEAELNACSEWTFTTPLGRINVLKSLFFSRFPYFFELVTLPETDIGNKGIKKIQSLLNNLVWNGKKPKMKLRNAAMHPANGGLGMINVKKRIEAIKIDLLRRAADVTQMEFWQVSLFSHFKVGFDTIIQANFPFRFLKYLLVKPLPPFWEDVFRIWTHFHFRGCTHKLDDDQIEEVVSRPAFFNAAFGDCIGCRKRWSVDLMDYFLQHRWLTVADMVNPGPFPGKGFITRALAHKICSSIPKHWRNIQRNNTYTIAQQLLDQKLRQKDTYSMLVSKDKDINSIISRWEKEGCTVEFTTLSKNVSKLHNGKLKNFFYPFQFKKLCVK